MSEAGDAVIVYVAALSWRKLSFRYASSTTVLGGEIGSRFSLRESAAPVSSDLEITVGLAHLGVEGRWQAIRPTIRRTVFESKEGSVEWHCLQPGSQVELRLDGAERLSGLGYAECLTVSMPPWKLPLEELHWGRFVTERDSLVWIDWRGPYRKQIVLHNGDECPVESLTESEIVLAGGTKRLRLDCGLTLRQGTLGRTVFSGMALVRKMLPKSILTVREQKWRSRGDLHTAAGNSSGWAIHEVVKWKA